VDISLTVLRTRTACSTTSGPVDITRQSAVLNMLVTTRTDAIAWQNDNAESAYFLI
jgi:hypothetical protein